jgi:phage tail-like protein
MMANYYPPVGFHFKVEVHGLANDLDVRFTEVSGLSVEMGSEEIAEGGENRFVQKYPTRAKYPELVLKRGLVVTDSGIWTWVKNCMDNYTIEPREVFIKLLNDAHQPLMTWDVVGAYPTKWAVSDFNASNNSVVVESLQLFYQYFTVAKS